MRAASKSIFGPLLEAVGAVPAGRPSSVPGQKCLGGVLVLMKMEESEMAKEEKITFLVDRRMADWIRRVAFDLDKTASEVLRAAVLIGLPTVRDMPSLVRTVAFEERKEE